MSIRSKHVAGKMDQWGKGSCHQEWGLWILPLGPSWQKERTDSCKLVPEKINLTFKHLRTSVFCLQVDPVILILWFTEIRFFKKCSNRTIIINSRGDLKLSVYSCFVKQLKFLLLDSPSYFLVVGLCSWVLMSQESVAKVQNGCTPCSWIVMASYFEKFLTSVIKPTVYFLEEDV